MDLPSLYLRFNRGYRGRKRLIFMLFLETKTGGKYPLVKVENS